MKKVAEITLLFWIMKICATTLGETAGDLLSMTLKTGYAMSSLILISIFIVVLIIQLFAKKFSPVLYLVVILLTSTAGTTISNYMDRTLGLGDTTGSIMLIALLITIISIWWLSEKSLSVTNITSFRPELFYWITILVSNKLGTALGDFLADTSGLGFAGGALLIGSLLIAIAAAHYFTKISSVLLFWLAFVLTRPFGATFGDLLTKSTEKGGLGFGTIGSSLILFIILFGLVVYSQMNRSKQR